jgi:hypothetical protein
MNTISKIKLARLAVLSLVAAAFVFQSVPAQAAPSSAKDAADSDTYYAAVQRSIADPKYIAALNEGDAALAKEILVHNGASPKLALAVSRKASYGLSEGGLLLQTNPPPPNTCACETYAIYTWYNGSQWVQTITCSHYFICQWQRSFTVPTKRRE